jgi:hypothetical protein
MLWIVAYCYYYIFPQISCQTKIKKDNVNHGRKTSFKVIAMRMKDHTTFWSQPHQIKVGGDCKHWIEVQRESTRVHEMGGWQAGYGENVLSLRFDNLCLPIGAQHSYISVFSWSPYLKGWLLGHWQKHSYKTC